ncbi:hypothetical protein ILYODFUR_018056 [Ilyodon furcidens]|uniref:Uncharacterized protein n=1 Tax=Ilyodon furcidens TaxID=33524 RepID=A0ABV0SNX2_9TELE
MRTHKNTHTHAPNVKTNDNGSRTLTYTPHTYSQVQVPFLTWATSPQTQEVFPFPPGVETGRLPQHLNLVRASPGSCLNLSDLSPDPAACPNPHTQRLPSSSGEVAKYKRGVYMVQTRPPTRAATE